MKKILVVVWLVISLFISNLSYAQKMTTLDSNRVDHLNIDRDSIYRNYEGLKSSFNALVGFYNKDNSLKDASAKELIKTIYKKLLVANAFLEKNTSLKVLDHVKLMQIDAYDRGLHITNLTFQLPDGFVVKKAKLSTKQADALLITNRKLIKVMLESAKDPAKNSEWVDLLGKSVNDYYDFVHAN